MAFAFDSRACELALDVYTKGWCTGASARYNCLQRLTFGLCFQHSEDVSMQEIGIRYAAEAFADVPMELAATLGGLMKYFEDHARVVRQFGRFPHRNAILGRESTAAEVEWLASPDLPLWAKVAPTTMK